MDVEAKAMWGFCCERIGLGGSIFSFAELINSTHEPINVKPEVEQLK